MKTILFLMPLDVTITHQMNTLPKIVLSQEALDKIRFYNTYMKTTTGKKNPHLYPCHVLKQSYLISQVCPISYEQILSFLRDSVQARVNHSCAAGAGPGYLLGYLWKQLIDCRWQDQQYGSKCQSFVWSLQLLENLQFSRKSRKMSINDPQAPLPHSSSPKTRGHPNTTNPQHY